MAITLKFTLKPIYTTLLVILVLSAIDKMHAQSFWKNIGTITDASALHSGILYSKHTNTLFVGTYNMGIFRSKDNGDSWNTVLSLPKDQPVFVLYEAKDGTVFAGGMGRIYRSDLTGEKWDELPLDFTMIKSFAEDADGNLFLCSADSGGILKSTNHGTSWQSFTEGLPSNYVNNLIADSQGNLFCTLINDATDVNGGLYYLNTHSNRWEKKNISISLEGTNYNLKVSSITAIAIAPNQNIYISLDAIVTNFAITGIFRNSVTGAVNNALWIQEQRHNTSSIPFYFLADGLFASAQNHLFACRTYSLFSRMSYYTDWANCDGGLGNVSFRGQFCEKQDGTVIFAPEFSNKLYQTFESIPGKKTQKITFDPLPDMKLYEYMELNATSSSGLYVKFSSRDPEKATIEGNLLRAIGLWDVTIRAYIDGNDSLYYNEENKGVTIHKAANNITIETIADRIEGDPPFDVIAHATSGENVLFEVKKGNAQFIGKTLTFSGAGRIRFIATEQGNGSYETADTVTSTFCINPQRPVITIDSSNFNAISLRSSSTSGNRWYLNGILFNDRENTLTLVESGIYTLRTIADDCISEESVPVLLTSERSLTDKIKYNIYPQPFYDKLIIESYLNDDKPWKIQVINSQGICVMNVYKTGKQVLLNTNDLPAGWYLLKIMHGDKVFYTKGVKME